MLSFRACFIISHQLLTLFWRLLYKLCTSIINCFSVFVDDSEHVVVFGCNLKVTNITKSDKQNQRTKEKTGCMMEIFF